MLASSKILLKLEQTLRISSSPLANTGKAGLREKKGRYGSHYGWGGGGKQFEREENSAAVFSYFCSKTGYHYKEAGCSRVPNVKQIIDDNV